MPSIEILVESYPLVLIIHRREDTIPYHTIPYLHWPFLCQAQDSLKFRCFRSGFVSLSLFDIANDNSHHAETENTTFYECRLPSGFVLTTIHKDCCLSFLAQVLC